MKKILKKVIVFIITLLGVSITAFLMFQVIPGDSIITKLGMNATPERIEALREEYGLNENVVVRYFSWLKGFVTGNGGKSYAYDMDVWKLVMPSLKATILLAVYSLFIIVLVSIPLGAFMGYLSGKKKGTVSHRIGSCFDIFNQGIMAVPSFFLGIIISIAFGLTLNWFIPGRYISYDEDFFGFIGCITPAAVSVAIPKIAMLSKFVKSSVTGNMKADYVRTAKSKGMSLPGILFKHVLRNALIPVITVTGVISTEIFAGSIVVEQVFGIPGLGKILVNSISSRDYPVVLAAVMYSALIVLTINLLVDISYVFTDPRIGGKNS